MAECEHDRIAVIVDEMHDHIHAGRREWSATVAVGCICGQSAGLLLTQIQEEDGPGIPDAAVLRELVAGLWGKMSPTRRAEYIANTKLKGERLSA